MSKKLPSPNETLYLLDISSFIFRAFFAIRQLRNSQGLPTNAVFGVAHMLARLIDEAKPRYLAVAYDSKEPSFRKELYPEYKANRSAPPEDLIPQFALIDELVAVLQMHSFRKPGVEADDIIASMTREWCRVSPAHRVVIVTGDKDLMQLIDDRVEIWDTMKDKLYAIPDVVEKFGVTPKQMRDYLTLVGDSSDNIPGAPGIGPKTAAQLLAEYQTLTEIFKAAQAGKISGKKGQTLQESQKLLALSHELVGLKEDITVAKTPAEFQFEFKMTPPLEAFLKRMEFHSIVKNWTAKTSAATAEGQTTTGTASAGTANAQTPLTATAQAAPPPEAPALELEVAPTSKTASDPRFTMINDWAAFEAVLRALEKHKEFGFDLETTSLNPREAEIVGIALCWDLKSAVYIPISHRGTAITQLNAERVINALKPFLENPKYKKIGQNLKYDWSVLFVQGIRMDGIGADTMLAGYLLDPMGRHNLKTLCLKFLDGYETLNFEEVCGKGKDQIPFDLVDPLIATRYSAEDAWCAMQLWHQMKPKLAQAHLLEILSKVDLPMVTILGEMECQGLCIDVPYLKKLSREFTIELQKIEERVHTFAKNPVNLNSPKQLQVLLFDELGLPAQTKTKTGYSTDASVLEALAPLHEVPRLLLEHREISKLKGTYVDPIPTLIDAKSGKLHGSFHQTVTATGRLSSSDPNLQNIPVKSERGLRIRKAFIPSPGNVLISADYSQIELRILAHMSGDRELTGSFNKGEDVHRRTASEIFNVLPEQVDDRSRQIAKAINFGLMYGKTPFGLAQELHIPRGEAKQIIDRYFERYSGVKTFLDGLITHAKERGWAMTELGRRRDLPEILSKNGAVRANAERMAMNTPIQGTAADLMKLAMIAIHEKLMAQRLKAKMVIQVHDEILLDCPRDEKDQVLALVEDAMKNAYRFKVPLEVNIAAGESWMEL